MRSRGLVEFLAIIWLAAPLTLFGGGGILFEQSTINVPAPADAQEIRAAYKFTNTGDSPITILETRTECGCTSALLDKRHYGPKESGSITVVFDPGGRTGLQTKNIKVITDEDDHPIHELYLVTNLKSYVQIEPRLLVWKDGEKRDVKKITITAGPDQSISIEKAESMHGFTKIGFSELAPAKRFSIFVVPLDDKQSFSDSVTFLIRIKDVGRKAYSVFVKVQ